MIMYNSLNGFHLYISLLHTFLMLMMQTYTLFFLMAASKRKKLTDLDRQRKALADKTINHNKKQLLEAVDSPKITKNPKSSLARANICSGGGQTNNKYTVDSLKSFDNQSENDTSLPQSLIKKVQS